MYFIYQRLPKFKLEQKKGTLVFKGNSEEGIPLSKDAYTEKWLEDFIRKYYIYEFMSKKNKEKFTKKDNRNKLP